MNGAGCWTLFVLENNWLGGSKKGPMVAWQSMDFEKVRKAKAKRVPEL